MLVDQVDDVPTLFGVLDQTAVDEILELGRPPITDRRNRIVTNLLLTCRLIVYIRKRRMPCRQLVREAAKGPDVDLRVVGIVFQYLGGHEALGSHSAVLVRIFGGQVDRETEICDLYLAFF